VSGFRQLDEQITYDGRFITVATGTFQGPDGSTFEREYNRHKGAVAVVPMTGDGDEVALVRQYRAAIDDLLLEIPAGLLDVDGEEPEAAARRELEEEIGRRVVGDLELLSDYTVAAGFSDHHVIVYLARRTEECRHDRQGPEEQAMTIEHVRLADVPRLVADGTLTDAKTIIGLLLARERLATP
jgi:8-oxo-dGTP pyrophosphatase MutT (NUDIX family)